MLQLLCGRVAVLLLLWRRVAVLLHVLRWWVLLIWLRWRVALLRRVALVVRRVGRLRRRVTLLGRVARWWLPRLPVARRLLSPGLRRGRRCIVRQLV